MQRFSDKDKGKNWDVADLARWPEFPTDMAPGSFRLLTADVDNNGAMDLVASGPPGTRLWLGGERRSVRRAQSAFPDGSL